LARARRRLADPERHGGRRALRVLHPDAARLHPPDARRAVAEQEDVAAHALDSEVLVDGADEEAVGLLDDLVVGGVGTGAAARDGGEPGSAPGPDAALHTVPVHLRRAPAAPRRDSLGEQLEDGLEVVPAELTIRVGAPDQREELLAADLAARRDGHALL